MLDEDWRGLSVVYVCPIRALLNNLEVRLSGLCGLVGRRCALWHGDIGDSERRKILADPPDILLTTPESIEVILTARKESGKQLLGSLRVALVDEIHAFAGDDRGWHLLAVLGRVEKVANTSLQRIGLSATVGNPRELLDWLDGGRGAECEVIDPGEVPRGDVEFQLDFVGNLGNAAQVISQLHHREKRLVFCDSRTRVEQLAAGLRDLGVDIFVSHGSLGVDERRRAEAAFSSGTNCVIVATSTLELGIDVGDLDRMIQIDAPATVASFLQRLGRTGRRPGTTRNALFLATSDDALLRAAGLLALWETGFVEPLQPPALPYHIAAQQLLAVVLQERGIVRADWETWSGGFHRMAGISPRESKEILEFMLAEGILSETDGLLCIGEKGERAYGRRNFLDLFSSFSVPPQFSVFHGANEIGQVDPLTFFGPRDRQKILLLAGRSWEVQHIDWGKKMTWVIPSQSRGFSRWSGESLPLGFELCQKIKQTLISQEDKPYWSKRTRDRMKTIRADFGWAEKDATTLVHNPDGTTDWWTFAGLLANTTLADAIKTETNATLAADNLGIRFQDRILLETLVQSISTYSTNPLSGASWFLEAIESLKFKDCLPPSLAQHCMVTRFSNPETISTVLREKVYSFR